MSGWLTFWALFLAASVALFVWLIGMVTVRGFMDIRTLLGRQREKETLRDRVS